jgi:signal transduction histidine kinase
MLEIGNRGAPIEPAILDRIFDPLTRGEDTHAVSRPRESLGLGLYIVREIAKAHGGEVGVRSDENETVFFVRLPRRPAAA